MVFSRVCAGILIFASFVYLVVPSPSFPQQPPDSVQSIETGDSEVTQVRRAYFTNYSRAQALQYYQDKIRTGILPVPTYRLNYPPEDAQMMIRDQTRSTFLEEIVHPFRESVFVNGFEPKVAKDAINYRGIPYRQKITIKYNSSSIFLRIPIILLAVVLFLVISREIFRTTMRLIQGCFCRY